MSKDAQKCARGLDSAHPKHGSQTGERKCGHRRVKHNRPDRSCAFCSCHGFIESIPR